MSNESANNKVISCIVKPMLERWARPGQIKDEHVESVLKDYVEDLVEFTNKELEHGFINVRRSHSYSHWPSTAAFRKACFQAREELRVVPLNDEAEVFAINRRAMAYSVWMQNNSDQGRELFGEGIMSDYRNYVKREACNQLLRGATEPNVQVPNDVVARWRERRRQIYAPD